jgi:predicted nucleic acid-binding protein
VTQELTTARATAREIIRTYTPWVHHHTTPETILRASEIAELSQISFWDALIVAAAEQAGASQLYSEDLNTGQTIVGVKIVNPLVQN